MKAVITQLLFRQGCQVVKLITWKPYPPTHSVLLLQASSQQLAWHAFDPLLPCEEIKPLS